MAGNLARYLPNWLNITSNKFILNIIQHGYKLQFSHSPPQPPPIITQPSKSKLPILISLIDDLLLSGAISQVEPNEEQHVYRIFSVKKKNNDNRLIIDLSPLNELITKSHFRMEDYSFLKTMIQKDDFFTSIDLSNAFHSIPLHESSKKFICFQLNNIRYCFNVIPFGLTSAPRIFTKILRPVISHLRNKTFRISSYLDDFLLASPDPSLLNSQTLFTIDLLRSLGYEINLNKSSLTPSHSLIHLGFLWDSVNFSLAVPEEKVLKIQRFASFLLSSSPISVRDISSFLGLLTSISPAFPHTPLHLRGIQFCFLDHRFADPNWDSPFSPDDSCLADLHWWSSCPNPLPSTPLSPFTSSLSLFTDASNSGWGAFLSIGFSASGLWSPSDSAHINHLELKAILLGLHSLLPHLKNKYLKIYSDNSSSVFYINKKGGTHSPSLCHLALEIWDLLINNNISCQAFHIPGRDNSSADHLSRTSLNSEFCLSHFAFDLLCQNIPFSLEIDLFASRFSRKLPLFVSRFPDNLAWKVDSFSFPWPNNVYIFPPISQIPKVIQKLICDNVHNALIITPSWPSLSSLPSLIDLLISDPIFIPPSFVEGKFPTRREFSLVAWPTSNISAHRMAFQAQVSMRSSKASTLSPFSLMPDFGKKFPSGSWKNKILPISLPP